MKAEDEEIEIRSESGGAILGKIPMAIPLDTPTDLFVRIGVDDNLICYLALGMELYRLTTDDGDGHNDDLYADSVRSGLDVYWRSLNKDQKDLAEKILDETKRAYKKRHLISRNSQ